MTGEAILLAWVCCIGTVFWPANPDAAVVVYVTAGGHHPLQAALVALGGQAIMLLALYFLGDRLRERWPWLHRKCERVQARWGPALTRSALPMAAVSGFIGVPPSVPTMLLAATLGLPTRPFLAVFFVCRAIWFIALAYLGRTIWGSP